MISQILWYILLLLNSDNLEYFVSQIVTTLYRLVSSNNASTFEYAIQEFYLHKENLITVVDTFLTLIELIAKLFSKKEVYWN